MSSGNIELRDCWAKTDPMTRERPALGVLEHSLHVGAVAERLFAALPVRLRLLLPAGSVVLAALHDIGKLSPPFQCQIWPRWPAEEALRRDRRLLREKSRTARPHATESEMDLRLRLPAPARDWAAAVGAHHGSFQQSPLECWTDSVLAAAREELVQKVSEVFGAFPAEGPSRERRWTALELLAGFITLADWLGSDESNFALPSPDQFAKRQPPEIEAIRAFAGEAAGKVPQRAPRLQTALDFEQTFGFPPNPLQQAIAQQPAHPGLHIIEGPMGEGKTEAALAFAEKLIRAGEASGLYFALPTQLTSNEIHRRIGHDFLARVLAEPSPLALVHSASWLRDSAHLVVRPAFQSEIKGENPGEHAGAAREWFTRRKGLLARFGAGTIDQALMATLPVKFHALRLFALAGKVVIFDEVHSYDAYTGTLLAALIRRLRQVNSTVVILSATLTRKARLALLVAAGANEVVAEGDPAADPYPLLTSCAEDGSISTMAPAISGGTKRVRLRHFDLPAPELSEDLLNEIAQRAMNGACVLVIRNTVALAQETYRRLRPAVWEGTPCGLIHSRFPFFIRFGDPSLEVPGGREAGWVAMLGKGREHRPREGCLLVATQVLEQSVDVDADLLVTDLAPTDLVLQRMGRLHRHPHWRHESAPEPEAWILHPQLPQREEAQARVWRRALLPHACIYPPHVLLRSGELWRPREAVELPREIRPLIEATYLDRDESGAWAELRGELRERVNESRDIAEGMSTLHNRAVGSDDEGRAPTRWIERPEGSLVLVSQPPDLQPGNIHRISFLNGDVREWRAGEPWQFPLAKSTFLNSLRVAAWQLRGAPEDDWLRGYGFGHTAAAFVREDGEVFWTDATRAPFRYTNDLGLIYDPRIPTAREADDIPIPDDEPWF